MYQSTIICNRQSQGQTVSIQVDIALRHSKIGGDGYVVIQLDSGTGIVDDQIGKILTTRRYNSLKSSTIEIQDACCFCKSGRAIVIPVSSKINGIGIWRNTATGNREIILNGQVISQRHRIAGRYHIIKVHSGARNVQVATAEYNGRSKARSIDSSTGVGPVTTL